MSDKDKKFKMNPENPELEESEDITEIDDLGDSIIDKEYLKVLLQDP